ncbi:hypothetical protein I3843_03G157900 [Carya illinoinensis]|nr:hypothetical protein I3843_03G157900 [Carya illinoinensis]
MHTFGHHARDSHTHMQYTCKTLTWASHGQHTAGPTVAHTCRKVQKPAKHSDICRTQCTCNKPFTRMCSSYYSNEPAARTSTHAHAADHSLGCAAATTAMKLQQGQAHMHMQNRKHHSDSSYYSKTHGQHTCRTESIIRTAATTAKHMDSTHAEQKASIGQHHMDNNSHLQQTLGHALTEHAHAAVDLFPLFRVAGAAEDQ